MLIILICFAQRFALVFMSCFVFLLSRSARKHRSEMDDLFYFVISWRWTLPMVAQWIIGMSPAVC